MPRVVRTQIGTNQQHGGSRCPDQVGKDCANRKKTRIDQRRSGKFTLDINAAGNDEQRSQEHDEGKVIFKRFQQEMGCAGQHNGQHWKRCAGAEEQFVRVLFPPIRINEGHDGNREQHQNEGKNAPQRKSHCVLETRLELAGSGVESGPRFRA